MKHDSPFPNKLDAELAMATANELRGKRSVRTTFKLSAGTIQAVSLVAAHLGIKQKSLFDHLFEEMNIMPPMANGPAQNAGAKSVRVQKTYVISQKSLDYLERVSKAMHTSRDLLVEFSVQRLLPMIEAERHQHEKRKEALAELQKQTDNMRILWRQACMLLGEGDYVSEKIALATKALEATEHQIAAFVERGRIIEARAEGNDK